MKRLTLLSLLAGILVFSTSAKKNVTHSVNKVSIIFDTDMGPDYDDVGALAVLNALADNGEVEILACGSSNQYEKSVPLIDIINTYYGRPEIPIGAVKGKAGSYGPWHKIRKWTEELPLRYPHTLSATLEAPDAVSIYRKVLSDEPDNSVTIVTVGFLTNMNNLLKSAPDQISPLSGMELVRKKVRQLVSMAGDFKEGKDACNILVDVESGKYVFKNWPTKVIISGGEIGRSIRTGDRLVKMQTKNSPVKDAYEIAFIEDRLDTVSNYKYRKGGRSSYDQTAVLVAARGVRNYFDMERGTMIVKDRAFINWIPDENGNHYRLIDKMPKRDLAIIIEDLMIQKPAKSKYSGLGQSEKEWKLTDGEYILTLNKLDLKCSFTDKKGNIIVPSDSVSGLIINGSPVIEASSKFDSDNQLIFDVTTEANELAEVIINFNKGIAKIAVSPKAKGENKVSLRLGGMPVAHGLGDAGAFGESFNLVEKENVTFDIVNNGGTKRWLSTFTIFPKNQFAGVFFDRGKKSVVLGPNTYQLNAQTEGVATFYFFIGTNQEIYSNFKMIRNKLGYEDIKPKPRLFELGWESWDALGWNTNQETVKEILSKFHKEGYPIRWAVTGSGFWETGGTTTNFGKWGEKFSDAQSFKTWMHNEDIKWMIGLRTNFVPKGGPYIPLSSKRDRNLKGNSYNGNSISDEGLKNNFFVKDVNGIPATYTSQWFPQVPCYLLDGNIKGAAQWYLQKYRKWKVDGIKEDTMMDIDSLIGIYNVPVTEIAKDNGLVMARNGSFVASGTLLRINDTGVANMSKRAPINYLQYAACGMPNVYSDVAGIHNMHNLKDIDASIRHAWLLSLTAGMAVGAFPSKWTTEKQAAFKKTVDFHYSLVPYLFSAGMKSYETGYPYTLTPMSIAFQNDENVMELENFQWMIGKSVLATPILKNHKSCVMDIYLPEGKWFDWETQEEFMGPRTLADYKIALDKTPCFVGGDGIVLLRDSSYQNLKVWVYAVNKKAKAEFFSLENSNKYEIEVLETDLNKAEVWDNTSKQKIDYQKEKNYIEFEIVEGHNYIVR